MIFRDFLTKHIKKNFNKGKHLDNPIIGYLGVKNMNRYERIRQRVIATEQEITLLSTVARKNRVRRNLGNFKQSSLPNNKRVLQLRTILSSRL